MNNNTAILFVGLPASGKSTALNAVAGLGIPTLEMSQVAAWKFEQFTARPPQGDDLRHFAIEQRALHHQGIFGHWATKYVADRMDSPGLFAVGGIRSPGEIEAFQREGADTHVVLVESPFDTRVERIQARGRDGEAEFTRQDLFDRDAEERLWGYRDCLDYVDWSLINWPDYTEDEFKAEVEQKVSNTLLADKGTPWPYESV